MKTPFSISTYPTNPKIAGALFCLVGAVFIVLSFFIYGEAKKQANDWIVETTEVTRYEFKETTKTRERYRRSDQIYTVYLYCPVVEFTTTEGKTVQATFNGTSGLDCIPTDKEGTQNKDDTDKRPMVTFRYNPDNPQQLAPSSKKQIYALPAAFAGMGVLLIIIGMLAVLYRRKFKNGRIELRRYKFRKEFQFGKKDSK